VLESRHIERNNYGIRELSTGRPHPEVTDSLLRFNPSRQLLLSYIVLSYPKLLPDSLHKIIPSCVMLIFKLKKGPVLNDRAFAFSAANNPSGGISA
jgi:hypothetical protein